MKIIIKKISLILFILTIINFTITKADCDKFLIGAVKSNTECFYENINVKPRENDELVEKFFRPSNLPILNTTNMNNLINSYFEADIHNITLSNELFKTPDNTIKNYFSLLREAANTVDGKGAGCGTLGYGKIPYKISYNFFTDEYKDKISFLNYEKSFENILHINLLKILQVPTDSQHNNSFKYFYEIEAIEGTENYSGSFTYYYGYIYLSKVGEDYKISDITITPETFLCAPYHGWKYDAESSVEIRYGNWCKLIDKGLIVEKDGYTKNVFFKGLNAKEYKIQFVTLTNDNDIEVAQYIKDINGKWQYTYFNPEDCIKNR